MNKHLNWESVAGSVIKATGTVEFEDGLWTVVLFKGYWYPWGGGTYPRTIFKPLWGCRLVLGLVKELNNQVKDNRILFST